MSVREPCRTDPDLFFSTKPKEVKEAKALCADCPLREQCEELGWGEEHGIWGGLSPVDRRKLDVERYAAAVAGGEYESATFDDMIIEWRAERERELGQEHALEAA